MLEHLSESKIARWLKNKLDVRLGAQLWALELAYPPSLRRPWKFSGLARVLGFVLYVAREHRLPTDEEAELA